MVLDDLKPVRTVAGDLKFESNPCNHDGIAPKQRCDTSQYRTGLLNELYVSPWRDRRKRRGVLQTARTGRDGPWQKQKVPGRRLQQNSVVWSGTYENCGLLCAARFGLNGRRKEQKVGTEPKAVA